jgi:anti-sigma factor RsiW
MTETCPTANDLQALLDEQLSDLREAAVLSHIEGCSACQETLERLTLSEVPSVARLAAAKWSVSQITSHLVRRF